MILPPLADRDYPEIEYLIITSDQVKNILSTLDCSKSTGCDQIGNSLLKEAAIPISPILCHIFSKSLTNGIYHETWKRALVIPLYKKASSLILIITDQYHYSLASLKSSKNLYSNIFSLV